MSTIDNGGSAFPSKKRVYRAGYATSEFEPVGGMSLRDYFAAKAMQGDWAAQGTTCGMFVPESDDDLFNRSARMYYRMADAMLDARKEAKP